MPRYTRQKAINDDEMYQQMFEDRGIKNGITQYRLRTFSTNINRVRITTEPHTWSMGDRFYKLSYKYYNTYEYWWVIALYNNKPSEASCEYGDVLGSPFNVNEVIGGAA